MPEKFYNFVVTTRMAEIRGLAQEAREFAKIRECPLPRVLATTIYSDYQGRCAQSHQGVSIAIRELENLGITQEQIDHELARDYKAVARVGLYGS